MPIYGLGMFLRIFPDSMPLALISGVISGIGASVTLLVIRSWIYYESDQDKNAKEALVSSRYTIMQIATLLAIMGSGWIISLFHSSNTVYLVLIILAAIFMGSLAFTNNIPTGKTFIVNEVIVGVIMIIASFELSKGLYISLIAYAIMSIGIAGFFIFKELMEYDMFPKEESFLYLGITQSGFLFNKRLVKYSVLTKTSVITDI